MEWRYLRIGQCDFCPNENARVYAPVLENVRTIVPPAFCMKCRSKYEAKHPDGVGQNPDGVPPTKGS